MKSKNSDLKIKNLKT